MQHAVRAVAISCMKSYDDESNSAATEGRSNSQSPYIFSQREIKCGRFRLPFIQYSAFGGQKSAQVDCAK